MTKRQAEIKSLHALANYCTAESIGADTKLTKAFEKIGSELRRRAFKFEEGEKRAAAKKTSDYVSR